MKLGYLYDVFELANSHNNKRDVNKRQGHEDRHFIQAILMGPAYYPSYVIFAGFGSIVGRFLSLIHI